MACPGNPLPLTRFCLLMFLTTSQNSTTHWGPGTQQASFWGHLWTMMGCTSLSVVCTLRVALNSDLVLNRAARSHRKAQSKSELILRLMAYWWESWPSLSSFLLISISLGSYSYLHLPVLLHLLPVSLLNPFSSRFFLSNVE